MSDHTLEGRRVGFILNMDANGLGIARSLGPHGIPLVGMDFRPKVSGLKSKYIRPLICPDPVLQPEAVIEMLIAQGRELGRKGVLFPASDLFMLFVSRNRKELGQYFDFTIPSEQIVEGTVNKRLMYDEARRLGVPIPDTLYPCSPDDVDAICTSISFPAFIKPYYSHLWHRKFSNKGFIVKDEQELRERTEEIFAADLQFMVQSIIGVPGKDLITVSGYFGKDGFMAPLFLWKKVRQYPPGFGVASLASSTHDEKAAEVGTRFFKGIGYQGIGSLEFKKDPVDNQWKLIELNGRTWMQNSHALCAGLNYSLMLYLDLDDQLNEVPSDYEDDIRWWDSMNDFDSFYRLRRRGQLTTLEWLRSWLGSDCYAYFAPGDIRPALARAGYGVELAKLILTLLRMDRDEDDIGPGRRKS